jgi:hypothetical protein
MMQSLWALVAMTSVGASEPREALKLLRNTGPLTVQNASPLDKKEVLGEVSVANRSPEGDAGFVLHPQLRVGTPWNVEVGAGAEIQNPAGPQEGTTGAASAYVMGQVLEEHGARPQLALHGQVTSPQGDDGVSAKASVLATKHFGPTRLHANVAYQATRAAADDWLVGLAADHPLGPRLLLLGDTYFQKPLEEEPGSVNANVGAGLGVSSAFVVTGTVGVNATTTEVSPRVLLGIAGRL